MKLKPHQQNILDISHPKFGLWAAPRTGKTPTAIRLACRDSKHCLVIVPKHIKEQWEEEIEKWNDSETTFHIYTKERFRIDSIAGVQKKGRRQTLIFSDKIPQCDMVIVDEAHRQASNYSNRFFKCLDEYISRHNIRYVKLLSGTPWNKNPWSVYSYLILLGYKPDWYKWQTEYFVRIGSGHRAFYKPKEEKFDKLVMFLNKIGKTVKLEDVAEVGEDMEELEYFDNNADQKRLIKNITDTNPAVRYIKQQQLEQGVLKSDGYSLPTSIYTEKDVRIWELAEDYPKLIIVCKFLDQIKKYDELLSAKGFPTFVIRGDMKESLSDLCKHVNSLDRAVVIVQADKSDGFDLKGFSTMVFASMSYSFISYDQMKNRMKSMEKKEGCQYIYLLTRGKSVDRAVYDSVKKGQDFNDKLFLCQ